MTKRFISRAISILIAAAMLLVLMPTGVLASAVSAVWDGSIANEFESGTGAEDDPYIIKTAEQLAYLAWSVNCGNWYSGKFIRLEADILLNDTTDWESWGESNGQGNIIAPVNYWTPIGNSSAYFFSGSFDGNGHTVSGIYIRGNMSRAGLFGYSAAGEMVLSNIGVVESYISGSDDYYGAAGGVIGYASGTVTNCYNTGTVSGSGTTGGVVGDVDSRATVANCYNTGTVSGSGTTGGVVGSLMSGTVTNCYNAGTVTGSGTTGGVVGDASGNSTVANCYNTGEVIGGDYDTGGVVGEVYYNSTVTNCYNTGTVSGSGTTGGVAGYASGTVANCYNTGKVTGSGATGGVVGSAGISDVVENCCYLSGCVENGNSYGVELTDEQMRNKASFESWNFNKDWEIGFDAEYPYPTLRCFGSRIYYYSLRCFDGETLIKSELVKAGGEVRFSSRNKAGLDFGYWINGEARYYAGDTFAPTDDTDFYAVWTTRNTSENVWDGSIDTEWDGEGTEASPYLISSAAELAGLAQRVNSGNRYDGFYFRQTADIALNDGGESFSEYIAGKNEWTPIGSGSSFDGNYDGKGYTVSGIYMNIGGDWEYAGLFGCVGGSVSGIVVAESYINNRATYGYVGAVVGLVSNYGTVTNCHNAGTVAGGGTYTGGVVGYSGSYAAVADCGNTGIVIGSGNYTGGVVGDASGTVANCQNTGEVIGSGNYTGGVVGEVYYNSTVTNCYNTGAVTGSGTTGGVVGYMSSGTVTNCYNTGAVTGSVRTGGVVGDAFSNSTVANCYNTGEVIGGDYDTGGVVGYMSSGTVTNCYNTGKVTGGSTTGGVAGYASGTVANCYNIGAVTGTQYTGGVAGDASGVITNSYNSGEVKGSTYTGGIAGETKNVTNCYNIGAVTGGYYTGGVAGYAATLTNCYYLSGCLENGNSNGVELTDEQMKSADAFVGFDFEEYWQIGVVEEYDYPTLRNVIHVITYTVTFLDKDGAVLRTQTVEKGRSATPPYIGGYSDGEYYYTLDHWDGVWTNVTSDRVVTAVYKQVAIIKFLNVAVSFTVENGFSREQLRVQFESLFSRKLCTTTNGYRMMCEVVWSEADLNAYDPLRAGDYTVGGTLKITDPRYSAFADYYAMVDGASVEAVVTVLGENEQAVEFEQDDLVYSVLEGGESVAITGYTGAASEIRIPERIGSRAVVAIGENAFAGNEALTAVVIPASVKTVGDGAFAGCRSLVQIAVEDGVEAFGERAFYDTGLVSVTLPDSVATVGEKAFGYYGEESMIDGFVIYCGSASEARLYAEDNGIAYSVIGEKTDADTGVSVLAEESVTLVVAQIEEGAYYENAQRIVRENDNVSLFEISIIDDRQNEVRPGNMLKISVPVPEGFDAASCEVFRINADGTYQTMHAKLIDGKLVFMTSHLSCYAIVEGYVEGYMRGDADGDGEITVSDALAALRIAAKLAEPVGNQTVTCDVDDDDEITVSDALMILRVAAKLADASSLGN